MPKELMDINAKLLVLRQMVQFLLVQELRRGAEDPSKFLDEMAEDMSKALYELGEGGTEGQAIYTAKIQAEMDAILSTAKMMLSSAPGPN